MPEPTSSNAKEEIVKTAFAIATTIITFYLARKMMEPDFARNLHMRGALTVKHLAQRNADAWQTIATKAANSYNEARV